MHYLLYTYPDMIRSPNAAIRLTHVFKAMFGNSGGNVWAVNVTYYGKERKKTKNNFLHDASIFAIVPYFLETKN